MNQNKKAFHQSFRNKMKEKGINVRIGQKKDRLSLEKNGEKIRSEGVVRDGFRSFTIEFQNSLIIKEENTVSLIEAISQFWIEQSTYDSLIGVVYVRGLNIIEADVVDILGYDYYDPHHNKIGITAPFFHYKHAKHHQSYIHWLKPNFFQTFTEKSLTLKSYLKERKKKEPTFYLSRRSTLTDSNAIFDCYVKGESVSFSLCLTHTSFELVLPKQPINARIDLFTQDGEAELEASFHDIEKKARVKNLINPPKVHFKNYLNKLLHFLLGHDSLDILFYALSQVFTHDEIEEKAAILVDSKMPVFKLRSDAGNGDLLCFSFWEHYFVLLVHNSKLLDYHLLPSLQEAKDMFFSIHQREEQTLLNESWGLATKRHDKDKAILKEKHAN